ncbi:MAG: hypothetical protein WD512_10750, partial [Candidatus Paceibacterota bacterium]
ENITPMTKEAPQTKERPARTNSNSKARNAEKKPIPAENRENKNMREGSATQEREDILNQNPEIRAANMEKRDANVSVNQEQRTQKIKERCDNVGMKIVEHQNKFKPKSQGRIVKYNQVTIRLEAVSTKLAEKGVDIATYNSYLVELKSKINALNTLNQDYIQLFGAKSNTGEFCNNKEQLSTEVDTRKAKLQLVISKDKEIRMYIKETILPYLRSIKPQEPTLSPEKSSTPSTENSQLSPQSN